MRQMLGSANDFAVPHAKSTSIVGEWRVPMVLKFFDEVKDMK